MLDMDFELNFEPSKTTKALWRYVRKSRTTFAGVTLPGLFQCSNFALDTFGFFAVIVLELWGLANLLRVGQVDFVFVAFLFALDIVFAVFRHLPTGGICERENRLIVVDDPAEKANLTFEIRWRRWIMWAFALLIMLVALFKVVSFYSLQGSVFNSLTAAILVSYLITWVLHISATGHFLFGIFTGAFLRYDRFRFLRGGHSGLAPLSVTTYRKHTFPSRVPIKNVRVHRHGIAAVRETEGMYELRTWGMLTDEQLHTLIGEQSDSEAKRQVALEGLNHQLDILQQSAPARIGESDEVDDGDSHRANGVDSAEVEERGNMQKVWHAPSGAHLKSTIAVIGLCALTVMGCAEPRPGGDSYKTFPLTVALTQNVTVGPQGAAPENLLKLVLPFPGTNCTTIFFPQVSFVRLDRDPGSLIQFERVDATEVAAEAKKRRQESSLGGLRNFYSQPASAEELREVVSHRLRNAGNWGDLAAPGDRVLDMDEALSFIRLEGSAKIFVLARSQADSGGLVERVKNELSPQQEVVRVTDEGTLAELIGAHLCDRSASASGTERPADLPLVVVLYQPVNEKRTVVAKEEVTSREVAKWPKSEGENSRIAVEPGPPLAENLRRIREDFEQGRLHQALQAAESLCREQPQREEIQRLREEIEKSIEGHIEVKVRGGASGRYMLNAQTALMVLQGGERSFRFYVEPHEELYFYLYQIDSAGAVEVLFPPTESNQPNPLRAGQAYWLPSPNPENGYRLQKTNREVKEIYLVSSRWPARELEQWAAKLTGERGEEASNSLLRALQGRKEAKVGGCDVRTLQFAEASRG